MNFDLTKYRLLKKSRNGKISYFKYSDIARIEDQEHSIFHYPYDKLSESDKAEAKIVLFAGKSGDGKSTAINAFFNIIKGVKLEYNFRLMLIDEEKKKLGQAESQTRGIHLYYLRDFFNQPLIIVDSQGFGDTGGIAMDQFTNIIFEYLFSNVIDHINTIGFIAKSTDERLHILTQYIIKCVTGLFAADVCENFFILASFANNTTMEDGPAFVETLKNENFFSAMIPKLRKKWYYSFDSLEILNNNRIIEDSINQYSYRQLKSFYLEAVRNSFPISIKNSATVIVNKNKIRVKSNKLKNSFQDIMLKQKNLELQKEFIEKKVHQIENINDKIENTKITIQNTSPEEQNKRLLEILRDIQNLKVNNIDQIDVKLVSADKRYTFCNKCRKNCHNPCDCWFASSFERCKVFKIPGCLGILEKENYCEVCGCAKSGHGYSNNHYVSETKKIEVNNSDKLINLENLVAKNDNNNQELYNNAKNNLSIFEEQKAELQKEKQELENKKQQIESSMQDVKKQILKIVLELQQSSKTVDDLGLSKLDIKIENDYIDDLAKRLDEIGHNKNEKKKSLNEIKELYNLFMKYKNININDLENMNIDDLIKDIDEFFESQKFN